MAIGSLISELIKDEIEEEEEIEVKTNLLPACKEEQLSRSV
jgi:hypothetical protein